MPSFIRHRNPKRVVLSTPLILEEGKYEAKEIDLEAARQWVDLYGPKNYCGHSTVLAVGLVPATTREVCTSYDEALVLKPMGRLEFGREYKLAEVMEIGVQPMLITRYSVLSYE